MNALRDWWRTRNDPPAMLPDPVRWTARYFLDEPVDEFIRVHGRDGWTVVDRALVEEEIWVTFRREDGAYRWRDDGFEGF